MSLWPEDEAKIPIIEATVHARSLCCFGCETLHQLYGGDTGIETKQVIGTSIYGVDGILVRDPESVSPVVRHAGACRIELPKVILLEGNANDRLYGISVVAISVNYSISCGEVGST